MRVRVRGWKRKGKKRKVERKGDARRKKRWAGLG
jgi:hypothetical protein